MFRPTLFAGAALAVVVMASSAEAQFRGLRFPASLQNVFMLRSDEVQNELKLSDEQKASLEGLSLQLQQDAFEIFTGLQDLTPEEQKEAMPEVMKMIAEKGAETQQKVDEIMDDAQTARLNELSLQSRGAQALEDDTVLEKLKISDEQKSKLATIREEANEAMEKAMQGLRGGGGGDGGDLRKQIGQLREKLSEKAFAVLTPEQREAFEKMKGAEFKFPQGRGFPF